MIYKKTFLVTCASLLAIYPQMNFSTEWSTTPLTANVLYPTQAVLSDLGKGVVVWEDNSLNIWGSVYDTGTVRWSTSKIASNISSSTTGGPVMSQLNNALINWIDAQSDISAAVYNGVKWVSTTLTNNHNNSYLAYPAISSKNFGITSWINGDTNAVFASTYQNSTWTTTELYGSQASSIADPGVATDPSANRENIALLSWIDPTQSNGAVTAFYVNGWESLGTALGSNVTYLPSDVLNASGFGGVGWCENNTSIQGMIFTLSTRSIQITNLSGDLKDGIFYGPTLNDYQGIATTWIDANNQTPYAGVYNGNANWDNLQISTDTAISISQPLSASGAFAPTIVLYQLSDGTVKGAVLPNPFSSSWNVTTLAGGSTSYFSIGSSLVATTGVDSSNNIITSTYNLKTESWTSITLGDNPTTGPTQAINIKDHIAISWVNADNEIVVSLYDGSSWTTSTVALTPGVTQLFQPTINSQNVVMIEWIDNDGILWVSTNQKVSKTRFPKITSS